jgi:hypothetical protein
MKKLFIICIVIFIPNLIFGWKGSTHELLSEYAYKNSKLVKEIFLMKLNLDQGFVYPLTVKHETETETKTVAGWIYYGADVEDLATSRSMRHFHNPLKDFNDAGLINIFGHYESSILWAQDGVEQKKYAEGDMSWQTVKDYYYNGLISTNEEDRQTDFGLMFKGLGHQMHLVQDLGNPEHTRNDNHPVVTIESWAEKHNEDIIKGFCENPIFPDVDLQTLVFDQSTQKNLIPISRLSDTDVYNPTNPIPLIGFQQGLAEYSNANFVSDDTIFSPDFPYPRSSGLDKQFPQVTTEYISDEKGLYASRKKEGEGEAIDNFVRVDYLQKNLGNIGSEDLYYRSFLLDPTCYTEYSSKLIPRSVGYSAALLDYFFRGEIEITLPYSSNSVLPQLDGIYSFTSDSSLGFRYISLMARNVTRDNEEMTNGFVSLVVSYRKCEGSPFVPNPTVPETERFFIKIDYHNAIDIPRDDPIRLDFDLSGSPLPVNAVDVNLTLVFHGFLGAEFANAVAIGFKDISEPTPIDLFNNSDKVCFNANYVNYNDAALWNSVDINPKNDKIDCLYKAEIDITRRQIWPIFMSFNGKTAYSENYYFKYEDGSQILPGETPKRIYVLADAYPNPINFSVFTHTESMDNDDDCSMYLNDVVSFDPYSNKMIWIDSLKPEERRYEHVHSPIGNFRGFPVWMLGLFENSKVPAGSVCSPLASTSATALPESLNKKSLGSPKIITLRPEKKSE